MFTDFVLKWLNTALDYGIAEADFWQMTIAELIRLVESKKRVMRLQEQKQASFDYILADLIGRSVARIYSSSNNLPELAEVYTGLFDNEEIENQKNVNRNLLSVIRFKQFANAYNSRYKGAEINNE